MNIVIDGTGGDNAPREVLLGTAMAVAELGVSMTVTGDEQEMIKCAKENNISLEGITLVNAPRVITMDVEPTRLIKDYADCSLAVAMQMVADGKADAVVSAGSTGALLVGATFIVKRAKKVKRPAIGVMIPMAGNKFYLLVDAGASSDCRPEMLCQYAVMGTAYSRQIMGVDAPRVGLINNGTEEHKGTELQQQAYGLLKDMEHINFVGNVEARELPCGGCDIAVCDGFTGNVVLKLSEGFGSFIGTLLKQVFMANAVTKVAAVMVAGQIKKLKKSLDYKEYGGAPILGVKKPVIKAHGSSDAKAFKNAIKQAKFCVERDVCGQIERGIMELKSGEKEE